MDRVLGADVSHHNGKINWTIMASKAKFVFIKVTEGNYFIDDMGLENIAGAISVGLPWGIYHFVNDVPIAGQMQLVGKFMQSMEAKGLPFPPLGFFIDFEIKVVLHQTNWDEIYGAFLSMFGVERLGVYAGQYTWEVHGNPPQPAATQWVANYLYHGDGKNGTVDQRYMWSKANYMARIAICKTKNPNVPKGWTRLKYWQFTGDRVPGSEFGCSSDTADLDFCEGDLPLPVVTPPTGVEERVVELERMVAALEGRMATLEQETVHVGETVGQFTNHVLTLEAEQARQNARFERFLALLRQAGGVG